MYLSRGQQSLNCVYLYSGVLCDFDLNDDDSGIQVRCLSITLIIIVRLHVCVRASVVRACVCACVRACMHMHTHMHTLPAAYQHMSHTHTHTHTHVRTSGGASQLEGSYLTVRASWPWALYCNPWNPAAEAVPNTSQLCLANLCPTHCSHHLPPSQGPIYPPV